MLIQIVFFQIWIALPENHDWDQTLEKIFLSFYVIIIVIVTNCQIKVIQSFLVFKINLGAGRLKQFIARVI